MGIREFKEILGLKHLHTLSRIGIDVDKAFSDYSEAHISSRYQSGYHIVRRFPSPAFPDVMTSELIYLAKSEGFVKKGDIMLGTERGSINTPYGLEYQRRLRSFGLSPVQITRFFYAEKLILFSSDVIDRDTPWHKRDILNTYKTVDSLPKLHELTFSELQLFTYDAYNYLNRCVKENISSGKKWEVAMELSGITNDFSRIGIVYPHKIDRLEGFGWDHKHIDSFVKHENELFIQHSAK